MVECQVCGTDIDEANPQPDEGYGGEEYLPAQAEYEGEIYQFCCSDHKDKFQATPDQFT